ncbi:hypothetical protein, partial [Treponema sp. R6D11]
MVQAYESKIEESIEKKYGVRARAVVEIDDANVITLKKIVLYDDEHKSEIQKEYKPEKMEVKK